MTYQKRDLDSMGLTWRQDREAPRNWRRPAELTAEQRVAAELGVDGRSVFKPSPPLFLPLTPAEIAARKAYGRPAQKTRRALLAILVAQVRGWLRLGGHGEPVITLSKADREDMARVAGAASGREVSVWVNDMRCRGVLYEAIGGGADVFVIDPNGTQDLRAAIEAEDRRTAVDE